MNAIIELSVQYYKLFYDKTKYLFQIYLKAHLLFAKNKNSNLIENVVRFYPQK